MARISTSISVLLIAVLLCSSGCQTNAERGAVMGGLLGAGTGALIGNQSGHAGEGAAIGTAVGVIGGALAGNAADEAEARNNAQMAASDRALIDDVFTMTTTGVSEDLIVNHIRNKGMYAPLQASDLINLQQQGVSTRVIAAMQDACRYPVQPQPVVVEEHHYVPGPRPRYHRAPPPGPGWSVSVSN